MLRLPDKANNKTKRWIVSSGFTADLRAQAGAMGLTSESLVTKTYIVRSGVPVRGHNRPKRGIGRDSRAYVCRCAVTKRYEDLSGSSTAASVPHPGLVFDRGSSAQQFCAFPDAPQTSMLAIDGVGIKATAPIAYLQSQRRAVLDDSGANTSAAAVLDRVVQAFLQDAINGRFQQRRQPLPAESLQQLDLQTTGVCHLLNETREGGNDPRLRETGWRSPRNDVSYVPQSYI